MNCAKGHHGDAGAAIADCILPGAAYTEKQVSFDIFDPGVYNYIILRMILKFGEKKIIKWDINRQVLGNFVSQKFNFSKNSLSSLILREKNLLTCPWCLSIGIQVSLDELHVILDCPGSGYARRVTGTPVLCI